jgi:hypothetical protein
LLLAAADCLLLTADWLLHFREAGWRGLFAGMAALDKMSPPTGKEKTSNFKKVKERRGNVYENKGSGFNRR